MALSFIQLKQIITCQRIRDTHINIYNDVYGHMWNCVIYVDMKLYKWHIFGDILVNKMKSIIKMISFVQVCVIWKWVSLLSEMLLYCCRTSAIPSPKSAFCRPRQSVQLWDMCSLLHLNLWFLSLRKLSVFI